MSATVSHHYSSPGLEHRKIAIWAFIGSECMLFVSLISTYLIYKDRSRVGPYPHTPWTDPSTGHVYHAILNIPVTSASTFILLMSSLAMVLALSAGIVVVNSLKLIASARQRLARVADMALQGGWLAFVAWALGAPRWFAVSGTSARSAASLELGLTLGVQVTLATMLVIAAISLVFDAWRLWRPEPARDRALNGA